MKADIRYLSNPDIAYYARKAGFSGDLVPVMVAIANAESGDRLALILMQQQEMNLMA